MSSAFSHAELERALLRREAGEPLAHVLGRVEFCELSLEIGPGVFVPRPRTEALVEAAIAWLKPDSRVLDVACGCGALAAAIKRALPGAEVHASDIDESALEFARRNGARYGFAVHRSDWLRSVPGRFDLVIAYLPHVPHAEEDSLDQDYLKAEGPSTVLGGADGLDPLRSILPHLSQHGGLMTLLEVGQIETARQLAGRLQVLAGDEHDQIVLIQ
ncbi:MAG: methyltransferase [Candidatus Eremiobacteraeota bacterium]|nr:methyltransferase [Candidatus Eremiobacteraeota bacterium]